MNVENMYDAWDNGDRHEIRQQLAARSKQVVTDDDDTQVYRSELEAAVLAEREACAKVCESAGPGADPIYCAFAIRARGRV